MQKEDFSFEKACVTTRNETEWVELVDAGVNELVGADQNEIIATASRNLGRKVDKDNFMVGLRLLRGLSTLWLRGEPFENYLPASVF